jgi:type III secretion system YscQ/HrcQ family protein
LNAIACKETRMDTSRTIAAPHAAVRPSRSRLLAALPQLSSTAVQWRNRAYACAPCLLSDERIFVWQDAGAFTPVGELVCTVGDGELAIACDSLARIEPRLEGLEHFVPTETCAALVEHALAPLLAQIERWLGTPVIGREFRRTGALATPAALGDEVAAGFVLLDRDRQPVVRGLLRAGPALWQQFDFERAAHLGMRRRHAVPLRLSVRLGGCSLSLSELRSLAVGDALRPTPRIAAGSQTLHVQLAAGARHQLAARLAGDQLTVEQTVTPLDTPAAAAAAADPSAKAIDDAWLDDMACEVAFELGTLSMTVGELARLRSGQTLRLGVRLAEQPVRVMVASRVVARGELATVGDELVVVLTDTRRLGAL